MPLIETVTYPECETPYELREAAEYIRFLNRSTGKVRTGIGSGREDVNVSCRGGDRVEIKGVSHNKWIPRLSHNEAFRQFALLRIKDILKEQVPDKSRWQIKSIQLNFEKLNFDDPTLNQARKKGSQLIAINLPGFQGILSHFTQPGKCFADELSDRLKVIACIEKPNMISSESITPSHTQIDFEKIRKWLGSNDLDAQILLCGPESDIPTALEVVQERCLMAFDQVPRETRKAMPDGTTVFERVLPGADRMYPDTDSAPIPLSEEYIDQLRQSLPIPVSTRISQMKEWGIPADAFHYLLKKNLVPLIQKITDDFGYSCKSIGIFLGHTLKHLEGQKQPHKEFSPDKIYNLFSFIRSNNLDQAIAKPILTILMDYPNMDFNSILTSLKFKRCTQEELLAPVSFLIGKFREIRKSENPDVTIHWLMGQIRNQALGNISMKEYSQLIEKQIEKELLD